MPRASKLKVINIKDETVVESTVQEMTAINEEIETPIEPIEQPLVRFSANSGGVEQPIEAVVMKTRTRAKAKAKAIKNVETVTESVTESAVEPVVEAVVEAVVEPTVVKQLVECPRCLKKLTPKGLQYSHKCPADKVVKPEPQPRIIERIIEKEPRIIREKPDYNNIPEEIIQNEIRKRQTSQKEQRAIKKEQSMKQLTMNIA